jgi:hypothetical protein
VPECFAGWDAGRWISADAWPNVGLPAPIRKLLQQGVVT